MKFKTVGLLMAALLAVIITSVPAEAQYRHRGESDWIGIVSHRNAMTINRLADNAIMALRGHYPAPPPMYGGYYGSPYSEPYYGNGGGRYGLDGRTLGAVVGGVVGGTALRKKGPVGQALGVLGGALVGGVIGNRFDRSRAETRLTAEPPAPYEPGSEPRTYDEERPPETVTVLNCTGVKVFLGNLETGLGKDLLPGQETEWLQDVPITAYKRSDDGLVQVVVTWEQGTAVLR